MKNFKTNLFNKNLFGDQIYIYKFRTLSICLFLYCDTRKEIRQTSANVHHRLSLALEGTGRPGVVGEGLEGDWRVEVRQFVGRHDAAATARRH
jgi:hypothetical protein